MPRPFLVRQHVAALESGDSSPHSKRAHCRAPLQKTRVLKTERGNHRRHREGAENTEGHWVGARQCLARFFGARQHVAALESGDASPHSKRAHCRAPLQKTRVLKTERGNHRSHRSATEDTEGCSVGARHASPLREHRAQIRFLRPKPPALRAPMPHRVADRQIRRPANKVPTTLEAKGQRPAAGGGRGE